MDERLMAMWLLYGEIVDDQCPDADEHDVIDTFHAILDRTPLPAGSDPRLIAAARAYS